MPKPPLIAFSGGGSAGHVTPNIALMDAFRDEGWRLVYFGTAKGIEREIIARTGTDYVAVPSGKLRRYFSWENFFDPFKIVLGIWLALIHMLRLRPRVLFSKGGFASVPPVVAAWMAGVPVVIHESDRSPGLANKLTARFAKTICVAFEDCSLLKTDPARTVLTGPPVREALFEGVAERGRALIGADGTKPVLLVFGGSLGARAINQAVRGALEALTQRYAIAHVTGAGNLDPALEGRDGYAQFEFLHTEFGDLLAAADLVVSRAGANAIAELVALQKPHLLIPLPATQSRGDQIENAAAYEARGASRVRAEDELSAETLLGDLDALETGREAYKAAMAAIGCDRGGAKVIAEIRKAAKG